MVKPVYNITRLGHKALVLWATDCAEHVLHYFEDRFPDDNRPRKAIEIGRARTRDDAVSITDAAFAAHAAAREALPCDQAAVYAARAAGQAAGTAHAASHAVHAVAYAIKASTDPAEELDWQLQRLKHYEKSLQRNFV
jgi:hypothetical protein